MSGPNNKTATRKKRAPRKAQKQPQKFTPTEADRSRVTAMIGAGVKTETIRKIVINPKTGKPIARSNFWRQFKVELAEGRAMISGRAAATLADAMGQTDEDGNVTRAGITASIFWLKTRESELFSERHINENIDKNKETAIGNLTAKDHARVAQIVLDQANGELEILKRDEGGPSIHDKPAGSA